MPFTFGLIIPKTGWAFERNAVGCWTSRVNQKGTPKFPTS